MAFNARDCELSACPVLEFRVMILENGEINVTYASINTAIYEASFCLNAISTTSPPCSAYVTCHFRELYTFSMYNMKGYFSPLLYKVNP